MVYRHKLRLRRAAREVASPPARLSRAAAAGGGGGVGGAHRPVRRRPRARRGGGRAPRHVRRARLRDARHPRRAGPRARGARVRIAPGDFSVFLPLHGHELYLARSYPHHTPPYLTLSSCLSIVVRRQIATMTATAMRSALALAILPALTLVSALELPRPTPQTRRAPVPRKGCNICAGTTDQLKLDEIDQARVPPVFNEVCSQRASRCRGTCARCAARTRSSPTWRR